MTLATSPSAIAPNAAPQTDPRAAGQRNAADHHGRHRRQGIWKTQPGIAGEGLCRDSERPKIYEASGNAVAAKLDPADVDAGMKSGYGVASDSKQLPPPGGSVGSSGGIGRAAARARVRAKKLANASASLGVDAKIAGAVLLVGGEVNPRKLEPVADFLQHNVRRQRACPGA